MTLCRSCLFTDTYVPSGSLMVRSPLASGFGFTKSAPLVLVKNGLVSCTNLSAVMRCFDRKTISQAIPSRKATRTANTPGTLDSIAVPRRFHSRLAVRTRTSSLEGGPHSERKSLMLSPRRVSANMLEPVRQSPARTMSHRKGMIISRPEVSCGLAVRNPGLVSLRQNPEDDSLAR